jgi:glycosyltransferase involved in cell wall biosynthesis
MKVRGTVERFAPRKEGSGVSSRTRSTNHIVMLGTAFETHGGISSVLKTYRAAGLFDRWPIDFLATHRDGGIVTKLVRLFAALVAFMGLLVRHRHAVLHVHSASRASFWRKSIFMALAMAARWPVIFHLHGGGFATFYDAECGPVGRAMVRFFLDRAACIVVVSDRWCAWMHRATRNPHVVTIANPVRVPAASATPREAALIAYAGRYEAGKGVYELLTAVAGLSASQPDLRLECAGSGDADALSRRAHALGIADRVTLRGWVDAEERDRLLQRATIFVLPSHAEGMPISVLEAMAAGCPVIATAVGGVPDLVVDGVNGLLVPAGDAQALAFAIHRVLRDPALAAQLSRCGRETVARRFAPEKSLAPLERLYGQLGIQSKPGDAPRGRTPGTHPHPGHAPRSRQPDGLPPSGCVPSTQMQEQL